MMITCKNIKITKMEIFWRLKSQFDQNEQVQCQPANWMRSEYEIGPPFE